MTVAPEANECATALLVQLVELTAQAVHMSKAGRLLVQRTFKNPDNRKNDKMGKSQRWQLGPAS